MIKLFVTHDSNKGMNAGDPPKSAGNPSTQLKDMQLLQSVQKMTHSTNFSICDTLVEKGQLLNTTIVLGSTSRPLGVNG